MTEGLTPSRAARLAFGAALMLTAAAPESWAGEPVAPLLEMLPVKDSRALGRATAAELETLTTYIAARMASSGAYSVRAGAASRAGLAAARKVLLAQCRPDTCPPVRENPDQVMEVTLGSLGKGCALNATIVDLRSLSSVAAGAERFDCLSGLEAALDRLLDQLGPGAEDSGEQAAPPPVPAGASLHERMKLLMNLDRNAGSALYVEYSEAVSLRNEAAVVHLSEIVDAALVVARARQR